MISGEVGSFPFGELVFRSQEIGDVLLFILPVSPIHHSSFIIDHSPQRTGSGFPSCGVA
ncbi:hypothetical protein [Microcystis sp. MC19]|uniref:hypothetical protein n=1 Tax=Microcystis sp. MC19 TaxID=1967666 RepID=UPI00131C3051|nr:hypothetical protein [Microcystis sp. MC19]